MDLRRIPPFSWLLRSSLEDQLTDNELLALMRLIALDPARICGRGKPAGADVVEYRRSSVLGEPGFWLKHSCTQGPDRWEADVSIGTMGEAEAPLRLSATGDGDNSIIGLELIWHETLGETVRALWTRKDGFAYSGDAELLDLRAREQLGRIVGRYATPDEQARTFMTSAMPPGLARWAKNSLLESDDR